MRKKQTRADAYFIIEISKKISITEIYIELYGWEPCDHIIEMR